MSRMWNSGSHRIGQALWAEGFSAMRLSESDSLAFRGLLSSFIARARPVSSDTAATPAAAAAPSPFQAMFVPTQAVTPLAAEEHASFMAASLTNAAGDQIAMLYSGDHDGSSGGVAFNTATRTLLTGGADSFGLGSGDHDQLFIGGDTGPLSMDPNVDYLEQVVLLGGSNYALSSHDGNVATGHRLTVTATALGAGNHVDFDGSAEQHGAFLFHGGAGADSFIGGSGDDILYGLGGADRLTGGAGADRFAYTSASESTGSSYDTLADFHFGEDRIDLPVTVAGLSAAVHAGTLSTASFDTDLAHALGGTALAAGNAVFFTADHGDLAGQVFLVVDANGEAGYQAGQDYVFHLETPPPADLSGTGFFV
jgi:Ca2+-binding RTX toxin-like protein